ncbi:MAG: prephenate dehydrogenase [Zetaproteobacteria bacterium CG2_30_46_52]|nr:MAG: prephenate dehydrogenase [Zetaproteobacteria bacterium CG2_30_46_52]
MSAPLFIPKLAIIGVGLIGGSLALALKAAGAVGHVVGTGRGEANLQLALTLGVIDAWTTDMRDAVADADMVVLAVPMGAYASVLQSIAPHLKVGAIVSDAGSTKVAAIEDAKAQLSDKVHFVAAHPLAGTEQSGAAAAFAALYQHHLCIITPEETSNAQALAQVKRMWEVAGCKVLQMPAAEHDDLLAAVSHLPHVAAFALVNAVRKQENDTYEPFAFAAGGFRDFTRIASSSPSMWRDIALANKSALIKQIDALSQELGNMKQALENQEGENLLAMFSEAKQARDAWLAGKTKAESSIVDAARGEIV